MHAPHRARNDPRQYDDLRSEWWRADGEFAALHWLARVRAQLIPAGTAGSTLLDVGCGGGLLAPHIAGYRHVGVDLSATALQVAAEHGVEPVQASAEALPFSDDSFDVVVAGEILEHVEDVEQTVAEALRVLRPGGLFVCDTINATWRARVALVTIGERLPGGPPIGCHDPRLFVSPARMRDLCAAGGVDLQVRGLRPSARQYAAFLLHRRGHVDMVPTRSLAAVYQGAGRKRREPTPVRPRLPSRLRAPHEERSPRGHAAIAGIGVALPPGRSQQQLWDEFFSEHYGGRRSFERVWNGCGVEFRHGVADRFGLEVSRWSTERRMRQFIQDAVPLGAEAIRTSLAAADVTPDEVDQLTVVSCTGYATPGLDTLLIEELGLDQHVQRLHIGHMGCHAAIPGLTAVSDAAVARGQVAVLLCLELTSLHLQPPTTDIRQLLVHALFSDAAAALVVAPPGSRSGTRTLEVVDFSSATDAGAAGLMTWDVTDLGFMMGLSAKVPEAVGRHVEDVVTELLSRHGHTTADVAAWAVHPGGPEILDVVAAELALPPDALDASRSILRRHGNCSSPTVLLVLDEVIRTRPLAHGEHVVALAFGPGLTVCAALLRVRAPELLRS